MRPVLELDSRDKLATSRSKVSASAGDAISEEAETVGNASVARILRSLEGIGRVVQAGISPAVKDVEEIRAERECHALLEWDDLAKAQLLVGISRSTIIAVERFRSGVGPGGGVGPRSGVEKERRAGIDAVTVEVMQEELLARKPIRPNRIGKSHRSQRARRIRCLQRKTALVMEDAVGRPAGQQHALPAGLRKTESRHLIVEIEVEHLRLVDGHVGFRVLGRLAGILYRHRYRISSSTGDCSQILRPRVTEAARQSVAEPLGNLDLKRVVPPIATVLVVVANATELREWPKCLGQGASGGERGVRSGEASCRHRGRRDRLRQQVEVVRVGNV